MLCLILPPCLSLDVAVAGCRGPDWAKRSEFCPSLRKAILRIRSQEQLIDLNIYQTIVIMGCFSSSSYRKKPKNNNMFLYFVAPNVTLFLFSRLNDPWCVLPANHGLVLHFECLISSFCFLFSWQVSAKLLCALPFENVSGVMWCAETWPQNTYHQPYS